MKIKVSHLHRLLTLLSEKTNEPLDRAGLRNMAVEIGGVGEDYLYKKIFYEIRNLDANDGLSLRDAQLNSVARYLGYRNIQAFVTAAENPADEQLRSLAGSYYLYVRQNSKHGVLLQSPAEIVETDGKFIFRMKGPSWTYEGEISIRHGCLFALLTSPEYKSFYHIYRIGTRRAPAVIQGIFSGVSTAFDPIGGRVVLLKVNEPIGALVNKRLQVDDLLKAPSVECRMLASYFSEYDRNNLSINKVVSFDIADLEE